MRVFCTLISTALLAGCVSGRSADDTNRAVDLAVQKFNDICLANADAPDIGQIGRNVTGLARDEWLREPEIAVRDLTTRKTIARTTSASQSKYFIVMQAVKPIAEGVPAACGFQISGLTQPQLEKIAADIIASRGGVGSTSSYAIAYMKPAGAGEGVFIEWSAQ